MQISICMMVKDEEKNIRRCLNSMKPILKNIDSELIIVDTGSTDNTVQIAKEYTDKIYFHKWKNDFSGMRNKSISYAKGKWILIIDADEEITDCSNIIAFLKLPESKTFNTGLLNVKNMQNLIDDDQYAVLKSPRLFKNDGYFHYEGIVHNSPIFKEPTINLKTTIVHYGYVEENVDVLDEKFIRTSTLLKQALEKEPENIYYIFQLSVTYSSYKDYSRAYEIIKKAYNLLPICKDKSKYKYVYYQMALCCLYLEYDEEAKKVCREGLEVDTEYIDLVFYLAKAQGLTAEYEEALENYKRYMYLCDNYDSMKINFDVSLGMYTLGQTDEALQDIVKICFKLGRFDGVFNFASQLKKYKYIKNVLELVIESVIKSKNTVYIKKFYEEKIISDKLREKDFFNVLEKYCDDDICRLFSNYENDYSKLYLLRYQYSKKNSDFENIICELSFENSFNNLEDYFGDVLYYKLKYLSSISDLLDDVWNKDIYRHLNYISKKYDDFSDIAVKYIEDFNSNTGYDSLRINKILCRYVLIIDKVNLIEYEKIFKCYAEVGISWIKSVRSNNMISDEYINIFKSSEEKFLVYMSIAKKNKDNKKVYLRYLKSALKSYPYMKKGVTILLESIKDEVNKADYEFEKYKIQVKNTINQLVESGNIKDAEKLISEYKKVVPDDIEIYSMEAIIFIMENKLDEAETCLYKGLAIDNQNFDLLYNLAYIFQHKGEYNKALIHYKRARNIKYYESTIRIEIDRIIQNLLKNHKDEFEKECKESDLYKALQKVKSVLFIDFNLTGEVNNLGKKLNNYGINVDLAYSGSRPDMIFSEGDLEYRKLLGITNINHLVEYINYYCYDIVHIFNVPENIRLYIRAKCGSSVVFNDELNVKSINQVIESYVSHKRSNYIKTGINSVKKENITILIPTYNRSKYLKRTLEYFNSFKHFKPYIFVLDSSFESNKMNNKNIVENFNNKKMKYYEFDSSINFYTKINFGIERITTDYVALCPDDDFLTEEGLEESINLLEKNKELYSVKGKNLYFIKSMSKLKEYDLFEGVCQNNVIERLENITKDFVPSLLYQVFRVDKFKNMYLFLEKNIIKLPSNSTFAEYLFYFMVICTGKVDKINVDLNIRDKSVPRAFETFKNFPHAVMDGSFNDNYKRFSMFLSNYIQSIGENKSEFDKNISKIFIQFLINFLQVPEENVILKNDEFDISQLEIGMRKSWVWPSIY
ncbi:TIGR00180 family glycosyltransferase [Clostridium autoethanogenum]|uniref:TIGR00180 family glycosyltransferase n=1 Tax=Clostridium autoethanogenum TaxID=84023 RepID=A0A3M0T136_9CLOT|nr:TIGR00180 family glycosyltransferase [Clostridium autoethanogenum]RMD04343.1 TIGR00180 family glycosyltransferase [Clostridium autoethanogenum]